MEDLTRVYERGMQKHAPFAETVDKLQRKKPSKKEREMEKMCTWPKKDEELKRIQQRHLERCLEDLQSNKQYCPTKQCRDGSEQSGSSKYYWVVSLVKRRLPESERKWTTQNAQTLMQAQLRTAARDLQKFAMHMQNLPSPNTPMEV